MIRNDSDLHSSSLYLLSYSNDIIVPGKIIIFDELSSVLDEFLALANYCSAFMRSYDVISATTNNDRIAIKMY